MVKQAAATASDAAADYLRRGWSIVPVHSVAGEHPERTCGCSRGVRCASKGKHPRGSWRVYQERRATEVDVERWWSLGSNSNIGIVTGAISDLVVLDVDYGNGGEESLEELERIHGKLPDTLIAITGGGGRHYYFRHPGPGREIHGGAGFAPGIDIRGDRGFVVAPPSLHESGRHYMWEVSSESLRPAPFPPLLEHLVTVRPTTLGDPIRQTFDLETAVKTVVSQGRRNSRLTQIAGSYLGAGKSPDETLLTVSAINQKICQPPLPDDEVEQIVGSIARTEARRTTADETIASHIEGKGALDAYELSEPDRIELMRANWRQLGVESVVQWTLLIGDDYEYILETDETEISLGSTLGNYRIIRDRLLDEGSVLLTHKKAAGWLERAHTLRLLVREVHVDPQRARDRLQEWLEAYLEARPTSEPEPELRKEWLHASPILVDGRLHLRPHKLTEYLGAVLGERITPAELRRMLRRAGWEPVTVPSGRTTTSAWREPK